MGKLKKKIILNSDYDKNNMNSKTVLGLYENVTIEDKTVKARVDTGAVKSSIDIKLASELNLGPIIDSRKIKNVHGSNIRPVVEHHIIIEGKKIKALFTLQNRSRMKFKILIGQNVLEKGFIVDPEKTILKKVK